MSLDATQSGQGVLRLSLGMRCPARSAHTCCEDRQTCMVGRLRLSWRHAACGWVVREMNGDVVVIGAGSAGAVVSRRLVEAGASVVLLEAGGEDTNPAIHEPSRVHELWGSPEDWNYYTAPQAGAAGRRLHLPRGKVLGGTSALNGMIHVHGYHGDYDHWAYLSNYGWSFGDVLPLFKRTENFGGGADEYRGGRGPLDVTLDYPRHPMHESIVAGAQEIGHAAEPRLQRRRDRGDLMDADVRQGWLAPDHG